MAQEPDRGAAQQALQIGIKPVLHAAGNARIKRIDPGRHLEKTEAVAGHRIGSGDVGGFRRRLAGYQCDEARAAAIDHAVGQHGGDDLAAQAVIVDILSEALLHGLGEIAPELARQIGIIGNVAGHDLGSERNLGIGEQHRELGPGQSAAAHVTLEDDAIGRQRFEFPVEQTAALKPGHQLDGIADLCRPLFEGHRKTQGLQIIVAQHESRHFIGHRGEEDIAVGPRQAPCGFGARQADLDIDLDVGGIDAGRIVDGIGIDAPALKREFDAGLLGEAKIGAFADDLDAKLARHQRGSRHWPGRPHRHSVQPLL